MVTGHPKDVPLFPELVGDSLADVFLPEPFVRMGAPAMATVITVSGTRAQEVLQRVASRIRMSVHFI